MPPQNSPQNFPQQNPYTPSPSSPLNVGNTVGVPPQSPQTPEPKMGTTLPPTPPTATGPGNSLPPTPPPEPVITPHQPKPNHQILWAVIIILILVLGGALWLIGPQGFTDILGGNSSVTENSLVPDQVGLATTSDVSDTTNTSSSTLPSSDLENTGTSTRIENIPANPPSFTASIVGNIVNSKGALSYYAVRFYENTTKVSPVLALATTSVTVGSTKNLSMTLTDADGVHNNIVVPISATNTDPTDTVKTSDELYTGDMCYSYDLDESGYIAVPCEYSNSITIGNGFTVAAQK